MATSDVNKPADGKQVVIVKNGPYLVRGNVPLVRKAQVVSEYGEPLTWRNEGDLETSAEYALCRCGQSSNKPFCDGTHRKVGFDGTEGADTAPTADRQSAYRGGTRLIVKKDPVLCMDSGFCGLRNAGIAQYVAASSDTQARSLAMAMVERCPSGALTYHIEAGEPDIEPDLPQQIADTTEITSDGPIAGPLWVTGAIPIARSDGQPFEARNRVTLCNCGLSGSKPLCDGTHRHEAQRMARMRKGDRLTMGGTDELDAAHTHERRFQGRPDQLRSPERIARLDVSRVVALSLDGLAVASVLDVGTGTGIFAEAFAATGLAVTGIDTNAELLAIASGIAAAVQFEEAPAEQLPFPDGSFDLVFLGHVLHESDDPLALLREARRVMRQRMAVLEWPYREEPHGPPLAQRISPTSVLDLAARAGLSHVESIPLEHMAFYRSTL